jgi:hypothetical protein
MAIVRLASRAVAAKQTSYLVLAKRCKHEPCCVVSAAEQHKVQPLVSTRSLTTYSWAVCSAAELAETG